MIRTRKITEPCRAKTCRKEIAFLKTRTGANMPVDPESLTDADRGALARREVVAWRPKEHVNHWSTCPARKAFQRLKQRRNAAIVAVAEAAEELSLFGMPRCVALASALCDHVMGNAKTCDAPICSTHADHVADEIDFCPAHATAIGGNRDPDVAPPVEHTSQQD